MTINIIFKKDRNQTKYCTHYEIKNNCLYIINSYNTEIFPLENIKSIIIR